jgi:hypothetical protein
LDEIRRYKGVVWGFGGVHVKILHFCSDFDDMIFEVCPPRGKLSGEILHICSVFDDLNFV